MFWRFILGLARKTRVSLSKKLAGSFIFLALLAAATNIAWYYTQDKTSFKREQSSMLNNALAGILEAKHNLNEASIYLHDYLITEDEVLRTKWAQKLYLATKQIERESRRRILGHKSKLKLIKKETVDLSQGYNNVFRADLANEDQKLAIKLNLHQIENPLFKKVDALITDYSIAVARVENDLKSAERQSVLFITISFFITLIFTPLFTFLAFENIIIPLRDLHGDAQKIKKGRLDHPISIPPTGDEIEFLAHQLREMTDSLKKTQSELKTKLRNIYEISKAIRHDFSLNRILAHLLKVGLKNVDATSGSIMLVNPERGELSIRASKGLNQALIDNVRVKIGEGISGTVAATGEPLILHGDLTNDPQLKGLGDVASSLSVPIIYQDNIIGVLNAGNKAGNRSFNRDDLESLSILAGYSGIIITNTQLLEKVKKSYFETIKSLVATIEAKDKYTYGHSSRVAKYAIGIARKLGLSQEEIEGIEIAAFLHDIGKIGIPDSIISKQGKFTDKERAKMQTHSDNSYKIISQIKFPWKNVIHGVGAHHERIDGRGYPKRLCGADIPLEGKILAVADTYDAMTTDRPYRQALSKDEAIEELLKNQGSQFDEQVIEAALSYLKAKNQPETIT